MIESAYLEHIALIAEAHNHKLKQSSKGEHVQKNTWLCASAHFWKQLRLVLAIDSEDGRAARLKEIRKEIENPGASQAMMEFHRTCFPDIPASIIAATWEYAGRAMSELAVPMLQLPSGKKREDLWREIDRELLKLKTLWMIPPGDKANN
jgi:hypothetical protein